tara:strand:+ start:932 stop:1171 length:240 start_codon:yes stop_codon:yes gene_type:complete
MSSFYLNIPTTYDEWVEMGEISFGKFYSYGGLTLLKNYLTICEKNSKLMSMIKIKDDKGKEYTAEEFVVMLSDLEVVDG